MATIGFALGLAAAWSLSLGAQAPAAGKTLQVIVVAIEEFDDPAYTNPMLQANIHAASGELETFFQTNFPSAAVTVLRSHDETTFRELSGFFRGRFRTLVNGNVALLFVLSHGEALQPPNPAADPELRIVTSDTIAGNVAGSTLSLAGDVIGNLNGLQPGSFLFGFIDTCHSGAGSSIGLAIDAALKDALGVKTMVMASSLSDQLAFQAGFSRALVKLWNTRSQGGTPPCTVPEQAPSMIRSQIQEILGSSSSLGVNEGYPRVLLHFRGLMCLETFGVESSIVDIINGTPDSYVAVFRDAAGRDFPHPIEAHDSVPVRLARELYTLSVYRNNVPVLSRPIDLRTKSFEWQPLGAPDTHQLGRALESAAAAGISVGIEANDVQITRALAYTAYMIANDDASAERVSQGMSRDTLARWTGAAADVRLPAHASSHDAKQLADDLQRSGHLKASGEVLSEAAKRVRRADATEAAQLAEDAYLAYSAAGVFESARAVRVEFDLAIAQVCAGCKDLEKGAIHGNLAYGQLLGNITALEVLRALESVDKRVRPAAAAKR